MNGKKNKKQFNTKSVKIDNFSKTLLDIIRGDHNKSLNHKQIAARLGLDDPSSRNKIVKTLRKLKKQDLVEETDRGKYKIIISKHNIIGILNMIASRQ